MCNRRILEFFGSNPDPSGPPGWRAQPPGGYDAAPTPAEAPPVPDPTRVLLLAEACNPAWTSVPLVGYNLARALSRRPDLRLTLATHVRNRPEVEADPIAADAELVFVDNEALARPLHRLSTRLRGGKSLAWTTEMALAWPSYVYFEKLVYRLLGDRLRAGGFDLIHRVTPVSPTMPSPLAKLAAPTPMILGPLNGGLPWPKDHPHLRRREREWLAKFRAAYKAMPYYRQTYKHAAAVLAGSRHTLSEVPAWFQGIKAWLPENAIDPARFPVAEGWTPPAPGAAFRFITVGRLVPYKGMDLILEAMGGSDLLKTCELEFVGDGPMRGELAATSERLGLADRVHFAGWLDQPTLADRLGRAQAFAFPSLREFGGGVVLEAMARGLPAVVVDYGGPAELATDDCALRVPMGPRDAIIPALRASMERLAGDPGLCARLGAAAAGRVRSDYTWEAKAERVVEFYRQVMAGR